MANSIAVTSPAFHDGASIPARFTCSGADVSPALRWSSASGGTQSLAITVIDPDAPGAPFVHWVIFNLPPSSGGLDEAVARGDVGPDGSRQGRNDFGTSGYRGPCPPPGSPHHYHFKVYALDIALALPAGSTQHAFDDAIHGHVVGTGELVGTFKR